MHIIIDGYNILKQIIHSRDISLAQRRAFVNLLGKYGAKKNHTITIVFDGGPSNWPTAEKDHGITVIYSGTSKSADDVIADYIAHRAYNFLVVSSDNQIKKLAHAQDLTTLDSLSFYAILKEEFESKKEKESDAALIKTSKEENPIIDSLMHEYSRVIIKSEETIENKRKSSGNKLSKKERIYVQKIKKL